MYDTELIRNANVRFGCKMLAIGIPHYAFALTLQHTKDQSPVANSELVLLSESDTSLEYSVKEIIRTHIRAHQSGIKNVAKALDLSVRSLQRRLAENELIFSHLLEQTRIETALMMLENSNVSIIEVAMEVGYKEASHFARAFKRNTGLTPQQYRFQYQTENIKSTASSLHVNI